MHALLAMDKNNDDFHAPDVVEAQPILLSDKTLTKTISTLPEKLLNPIDPKLQSSNDWRNNIEHNCHLYSFYISISHLVDILACMRNI